MAVLPTPGGNANNWGSVLNDYLQQSLASDGTLVTSSTNSYTGSANTNLASGSKPGLVQLAGDLGNTAASPTVVGLQGRAVGSGTPSNGNVLAWSSGSSQWQPTAASGGGNVSGPVSSTDTAIARWNGTGGTTIENSTVTVDVSGNLSGATLSTSSNTLTIGADQSFSSHKVTNLANGSASADAVNFSQLGDKAANGANSDITSLSGLTTALSVPQGGSGADTLTGILKGNGTSAFTAVAAPSGTIVGTSDTQTFTNKRNTARIGSTASSATPSINTDNFDIYNITALAANITSMTTGLSGTPNDGDKLIIRLKDNGTGRTIAWGASFASSGVATLLATTVAGKQHTVGLIYSSNVSQWICLAVDATGY